jgi:hypothetical protein
MAGQVISEAGKVKYAGMFTGAMHLYLGSCQTDANQSRIRQVCAALVSAERPPLGESGETVHLVDGAAGEAPV